MGYSSWSRKESDTTKQLTLMLIIIDVEHMFIHMMPVGHPYVWEKENQFFAICKMREFHWMCSGISFSCKLG